MNLQVLEEGSLFVKVTDGNYEFWLPRKEFLKRTAPKQEIRKVYTPKLKSVFSLDSLAWERICEIFKNDVNFRMPVSVPPDQRQDTEDEIGSDEGTTVATERKLMTSYDVIYSYSLEIVSLLETVGIQSKPFFKHENICLAHGHRKAFYFKLLELGFSPSKLSQ